MASDVYDAIPEELRNLPQWVCANNDSKVPMIANAPMAASSTNPDTWSTFETACKAVADGLYDYLGFVFNNNGIVGIDIDKGFEDGKATELCRDIMSACMSYTEMSKSGRGVHIFLKGTLPFPGRNNRAGVEIYQAKRFFITTGKVYGFRYIIENQSGIDYVLRKYFPETEREGSSGKRNTICPPTWTKPEGTISLVPKYQEIAQGGRNISLLSIAGQLRSAGYRKHDILRELTKINADACKPPLLAEEVESIVRSIMRYKR